jgi:secreted trypsin-like serine protease
MRRVGVAIVLSSILFMGSGCSDQAASIQTDVQTKISAFQNWMTEIQHTLAKAKAIYDILHSDDVPTEPSADGTEAPAAESEVTPSVQPSADQPQPEAASSTTFQ